MDMKTVQKMQADADNAKGELIANMQKTSVEAVKRDCMDLLQSIDFLN